MALGTAGISVAAGKLIGGGKKVGSKEWFEFDDLVSYEQHALGVPDAYIMQRGGWGTDNVLKSVYRHTMSDRASEVADIANEHF